MESGERDTERTTKYSRWAQKGFPSDQLYWWLALKSSTFCPCDSPALQSSNTSTSIVVSLCQLAVCTEVLNTPLFTACSQELWSTAHIYPQVSGRGEMYAVFCIGVALAEEKHCLVWNEKWHWRQILQSWRFISGIQEVVAGLVVDFQVGDLHGINHATVLWKEK